MFLVYAESIYRSNKIEKRAGVVWISTARSFPAHAISVYAFDAILNLSIGRYLTAEWALRCMGVTNQRGAVQIRHFLCAIRENVEMGGIVGLPARSHRDAASNTDVRARKLRALPDNVLP